MLARLKRRRMVRRRGERGYTLIEAATTIALIATVLAIAVPVVVDQLEKARVNEAAGMVASMTAAMDNFFKDTQEFPGRGFVTPTTTAVSGGGALRYFKMMRSGRPNVPQTQAGAGLDGSLAGSDPDFCSGPDATFGDAGTDFECDAEIKVAAAPDSGTAGIGVGGFGSDGPNEKPFVGNINDHLVNDFLGSDPTESSLYVGAGLGWKQLLKVPAPLDPWGNAYIIYNTAHDCTLNRGEPKFYGWVLSAGPNQVIETSITDANVRGDDIGRAAIPAKMRDLTSDEAPTDPCT